MSTNERKYTKFNEEIKVAMKEQNKHTIEEYLEAVQFQVILSRQQQHKAERLGMKLESSEHENKVKNPTDTKPTIYNNTPKRERETLKTDHVWKQQEEQPQNKVKRNIQESRRYRNNEHRCRGCRFPHYGNKEQCRMKLHPDFNNEDKPFQDSTIGIIYYTFNRYHLDNMWKYNGNTKQMDQYGQVCQCVMCLSDKFNTNFLTATITYEKIEREAEYVSSSEKRAAGKYEKKTAESQTYQVLLDTGALNDNYINENVALNMLKIYDLRVINEDDCMICTAINEIVICK
eukprot:gene7341-14988_t